MKIIRDRLKLTFESQRDNFLFLASMIQTKSCLLNSALNGVWHARSWLWNRIVSFFFWTVHWNLILCSFVIIIKIVSLTSALKTDYNFFKSCLLNSALKSDMLVHDLSEAGIVKGGHLGGRGVGRVTWYNPGGWYGSCPRPHVYWTPLPPSLRQTDNMKMNSKKTEQVSSPFMYPSFKLSHV